MSETIVDEEAKYAIEEEAEAIGREIRTVKETLDSLEENYDFIQQKVTRSKNELNGIRADDIERLDFSGV